MESAAHKATYILILGSDFAAIEVLKKLQKEFHNNKNIKIYSQLRSHRGYTSAREYISYRNGKKIKHGQT